MSTPRRARLLFGAGLAGALLLGFQCRAADTQSAAAPRLAHGAPSADWDLIFGVLQHPRCMNCHPLGDAPLQGDASAPHLQNVRRGPDGRGLFAMGCATCHQEQNLPGPHLPPGAPNWHLPHPAMPLVFQGRSSSELCRQLRDPAQNGGKTPEQLFDHMAHDALVMWGWSPGEGRTPVPVAHDVFAAAVRAWVDGGCDCPE